MRGKVKESLMAAFNEPSPIVHCLIDFMKREENLLKTSLEFSVIFLSFHKENHEYNKH